MQNPYCSCKLTRVRPRMQFFDAYQLKSMDTIQVPYSCNPCGEPLLQL